MNPSVYQIPVPLPLKMLRNVSGHNPLIINYHMVSDHALPYVNKLYNYRDTRTFVEDIHFLTRHYHPIGLPQLLDHLSTNKKLPEHSFMITFDDGFKEVHDIVLPVLKSKKLTSTFFLTTHFLDNKEMGYMNKKSLLVHVIQKITDKNQKAKVSELLINHHLPGSTLEQSILKIKYQNRFLIDQIAQILNFSFDDYLKKHKPYLTSEQVHQLIAEGITIGGHSLDHARFSELTLEDQVFQSVSSSKFLQEQFNLNYKVFAFPFNDIQISKQFFEATSHYFDATFGTQGMKLDCIKNNFQRVNLEKYKQSAQQTLKFMYARNAIHKILNKEQIIR